MTRAVLTSPAPARLTGDAHDSSVGDPPEDHGPSPLRIGHYARHMFEPGGVASYIRRISAAQIAAGHEVVFFDRNDPTAVCRHAHPDGHPIIYSEDDGDLLRRATELRLDVLHLHTAVEPEVIPDSGEPTMLPRVIRTVHTHAPYCPSQGRYLERPGVPCDRAYSFLGCLWGHVFNRCGSLRYIALRRNFRTTRSERAGLPKLTTIVVSQFLKDQMVRAGYPGGQIHVLHLPVPSATDPTALMPASPVADDARPRFLFLGRMVPHKGVEWLLRSMKLVKSDVTLDLGGAGGHESQYRELARHLGLEDRVRFLGWLSPEQVGQALEGARALVFPSVWHEPGGTVAFEAMAHGRPVIVSRVGGMPEVVADGETGLIVPPGDSAALAGAIDQLAGDVGLARRMGEVALRRAREWHGMGRHLEMLMRLYQGVGV